MGNGTRGRFGFLLRTVFVLSALWSAVGCGEQGREITVTPVSQEVLDSIEPGHQGYSFWNEDICKIFILKTLQQSDYPLNSPYDAVLGHEMRHCLEGNYH